MAYIVNRYNGTQLVVVEDGTIDNTTDLKLIGKNYAGYGEIQNENFVYLLENFAGANQPPRPIAGQLWFDTSENRLKVYDGYTFRSTDNSKYTYTKPASLVEGDIWIDGSKDQVFFWNGTETVLVGPVFDKTQATTGDVVETIKDTLGQNINTPEIKTI